MYIIFASSRPGPYSVASTGPAAAPILKPCASQRWGNDTVHAQGGIMAQHNASKTACHTLWYCMALLEVS